MQNWHHRKPLHPPLAVVACEWHGEEEYLMQKYPQGDMAKM